MHDTAPPHLDDPLATLRFCLASLASYFNGCAPADLIDELLRSVGSANTPLDRPPDVQPERSAAAEKSELHQALRAFANFCMQLAAISPLLPAEGSPLPEPLQARLEELKLQAMRDLAYGASHEINNPLANISTRAQSLLKTESNPEKARSLAAIHAQAMRAHEMIADLMLYAKPPRPKLAPLDPAHEARLAVKNLMALCDERKLTVHVDMAPGSEILADGDQIRAALVCLLRNALEASAAGSRVELRGHRGTEGSPQYVFEVRDHGPGLALDLLGRAFNPFFSGREAGRGLGLGLSKAWIIAHLHGGVAELENHPEGGCVARITIKTG